MVDVKVFAKELEDAARQQVDELGALPAFEGAMIRIMPDAHAGKGSVVGFTAHVTNGRVVPNVVGVDIGCGMLAVPVGERELDPQLLDSAIARRVPSGMDCHATNEGHMRASDFDEWRCAPMLQDLDRLTRSLGTLGGGNHFIEVDEDDEGCRYLVVHTGSRNLGKQVAEAYQKMAAKDNDPRAAHVIERARIIDELRSQGRQKEIQETLGRLREPPPVDEATAYLEGPHADDYLHDMLLTQQYARRNREIIASRLCDTMGWDDPSRRWFHVTHNYVEVLEDGTFLIRKGAISARKDEPVLIPLNMRDGCLLGVGKGNPDWNQSAPHGAGRRLSRTRAMESLSMDEYRCAMRGIWSTSVCLSTLDESPMAYKDSASISSLVEPTVQITRSLRPLYNFKAH